jgi:hypothetical protein
MRLGEFLKLVLPHEGFKCAVEFPNKKHYFTESFDELAATIRDIDARGQTAYFACASFKTVQNRRQVNAGWAKSFWLDIDVGEGKPYATVEQAIISLDGFCDRAGLVYPGLVKSGSGLHAYWILDRAIDSATWCAVSKQLKALTESQGLHADGSRTADIASILRPPETFNRKLPEARRVEIEEGEFGENDTLGFITQVLEAHVSLLSGQPSKEDIRKPLGIAPQGISNPSVNDALLGGLSKGSSISMTQGYPDGQRTEELKRRAGWCFSPAGRMDLRQAIDTCIAWNNCNLPPLPEDKVRKTVAGCYQTHLTSHPPILPVEQQQLLPQVPGFRWNGQQQLEVRIEEDEEIFWRLVSRFPIFPGAIMNDEGDAQNNSYMFKKYHPQKGWMELLLSAAEMNGQNWYAELFKRGGASLEPGMDKYFKTYTRKVEVMLRENGEEIIRYNQFGWKDNFSAFLVGDVLIKNGVPQKAFGTDKLQPYIAPMALPVGGSLEEWTQRADKLGQIGMEAHLFAVVCSFASTLMPFCAGMGDGGSILSLVSEKSGTGKSPTTEAIASVWGDLKSVVDTGNFTENRLIEDLVRGCNLPRVTEEMHQRDPNIAAACIKKFTVGCDRGRLNMKGAQVMVDRFQTILISVSNHSLVDLIRPIDDPASRRIFEIRVPRPDNKTFENFSGLTREMMRHRGHAGRRFAQIITVTKIVEFLATMLGGTEEQPGTTIMKYRATLQTQAEHRFLVWLLSTVEVAALILTQWGIMHFDVKRLMDWAVKQASTRMVESTAGDGGSQLNTFLSDNLRSTLVVPHAFKRTSGPVLVELEPTHKLIIRMERDTSTMYVSREALQEWCTKRGIMFEEFLDRLTELRCLKERKKYVTLGAGTKFASSRIYCCEIDMANPALSGGLQATEKEVEHASVLALRK